MMQMSPHVKEILVTLSKWSVPLTLGSLVLSLAGVWFVAWLVIRLPDDHFVRRSQRPVHRHPLLHAMFVIICNVIGIGLILLGIMMLVLPGQGILTLLLGLSLVSLPGKHSLNRWLLQRKTVRKSLNWIRRRAHRPPLIFPD